MIGCINTEFETRGSGLPCTRLFMIKVSNASHNHVSAVCLSFCDYSFYRVRKMERKMELHYSCVGISSSGTARHIDYTLFCHMAQFELSNCIVSPSLLFCSVLLTCLFSCDRPCQVKVHPTALTCFWLGTMWALV
jgi:hypothetical protein